MALRSCVFLLLYLITSWKMTCAGFCDSLNFKPRADRNCKRKEIIQLQNLEMAFFTYESLSLTQTPEHINSKTVLFSCQRVKKHPEPAGVSLRVGVWEQAAAPFHPRLQSSGAQTHSALWAFRQLLTNARVAQIVEGGFTEVALRGSGHFYSLFLWMN